MKQWKNSSMEYESGCGSSESERECESLETSGSTASGNRAITFCDRLKRVLSGNGWLWLLCGVLLAALIASNVSCMATTRDNPADNPTDPIPITTKSLEGTDSNVTVITGWWNIGLAKHSKASYAQWRENFRQLKANKIIFTNEAQHFAGWENTIIVNSSPKDMLARTGHTEEEWEQMHQMYLNSAMIKTFFTAPNKQLYYIWNGRTFLLDQVRNWNPYNSEWFFWMDAGGARETERFQEELQMSTENMDKNKFHLFTPQEREDFPGFNFAKSETPMYVKKETEFLVHSHNCIQGGIYGGHKDVIPGFTAKWKAELDRFFDLGLFAGKDESMLTSLYMQNPDDFEVHGFGSQEESGYTGNPWFYWFQFFNKETKVAPYQWVNNGRAHQQEEHNMKRFLSGQH